MGIRPVRPADRSAWLRMLLGLYPGTTQEEHAAGVDAYLAGQPGGHPPHAAVFVYEPDGEMPTQSSPCHP